MEKAGKDTSFDLQAMCASLRADAIYAWRHSMKRKVTTGAAVLSLALAVGACTAVFRLVDAVFLRPMPVADPTSLYVVSYKGFNLFSGKPRATESNSYPMFLHIREQLRDQADLVAVSFMNHIDVTYGSDAETEKAYRQWVSGEMFSNFGLKPALGRLLMPDDNSLSGGKPYAVISYDYWTRRFGQDPRVIGRTFHMSDHIYEIVGVGPKGFTGTEPGTMTDLFAPIMMEPGSAKSKDSFWLRIFVRAKPQTNLQTLQSKMDSLYQSWEKERAQGFLNYPKQLLAKYPGVTLMLRPAGSGASNLQNDYRSALIALSVLVVMVLLIACTNVANLLAAQASSREREMALRVSIGASHARLVQMTIVESAMLGLFAAVVGMLFAWWATPFVVSRINPPDDPARLVLSTDWSVVAFELLLTFVVTVILGLIPALRTSEVQPVSALKGSEKPHTKRRVMYGMVAAQVAFCFVVLFVAGLFAATFKKLTNQSLGFSSERLLLLDTVTRTSQPAVKWDQMAQHLQSVPGVESTALEAWPLMSGTMHNDRISVNNAPPSETLTFFLGVSPGWLHAMKIPLAKGRDFRDSDTNPHVAIVNQTFAKLFFNGSDPVGRTFETRDPRGANKRFEIVGLASDVVYRDLREPNLPQAYVPMHEVDATGALRPMREITIVVRTATEDSILLSESIKHAVTQADPEFRVSTVTTQTGLIAAQTVQERLLATLALFFAGVALLLAAIGLYGVLNYLVMQQEREIGIRIAIGAQAGNIAALITTRVFAMVVLGAIAGLLFGQAAVRSVATLLYGVKPTDLSALLTPSAVLLSAALLAALPAVRRAVKVDPAVMLRAE
jgi:predicted permease